MELIEIRLRAAKLTCTESITKGRISVYFGLISLYEGVTEMKSFFDSQKNQNSANFVST